MFTLDGLMEKAKSANGRARQRTIGQKEAAEMLGLVEQYQEDGKVHTIRVYSRDGFVANSYKYRAEIRYFEARRKDDGQFEIVASWGDAKRSRGQGALVTVNGRGL